MTGVRLGLRENLGQFGLLVLVNAFVGAMIGLERSILPAMAEQEFQLVARTAIFSFIVAFGISKALTNYLAGRCSDRFGRKPVLVGRRAGALHAHVGARLELGARGQCAARGEPGADLVNHGDHEDRPGRPQAARPGHGLERVRRLPGRRR